MNKKQKEKLKEIIEGGKWNYVLKIVGYFGGIMFLFFILWQKFILEEKIESSDITFNFILLAIVGLIVGLLTWSRINKKFKEK